VLGGQAQVSEKLQELQESGRKHLWIETNIDVLSNTSCMEVDESPHIDRKPQSHSATPDS
jgi:hypothetical protein